jgi:hypothetical protein
MGESTPAVGIRAPVQSASGLLHLDPAAADGWRPTTVITAPILRLD